MNIQEELYKAIELGLPVEAIQQIIADGADVRAENDCAIRMAAYYGHTETVKALTELGADVRAENDEAIRYAAYRGHIEMVKLLAQLGAGVRALDN